MDKIHKKSILNFIKVQNSLIAFLIFFIFASIKYDRFLTVLNLNNVLRQASIIGIISIGMTFVIITGCIDLSVGSVLALGGVLAANLTGKSVVLAILVPLIVCGGIGFINGYLVAKMKTPPFIATLAMMMGVRGIAYIATGEVSVSIDRLSEGFLALGRGSILGFPIPSIIFITILIITTYTLKYLNFGRHVFAVGGNEEAARMMGLQTDKIKIKAYILSGTLAGLAGIILASRLGAGQPVAGEAYEMQAITSVVLGGTLLTGGIGSMPGTLVGVLTLSIITNIFNMQGNISTWWQNVLMGLLLVFVVIMQAVLKREKVNS